MCSASIRRPGQEPAAERGGLGEERSGPVRVAARAQHAAPLEPLADPRLGAGTCGGDLVEQGLRLVVALLQPERPRHLGADHERVLAVDVVSSARSRTSEPAASSKFHASSIAAATSCMSACCHFTNTVVLSTEVYMSYGHVKRQRRLP
jgi:hypothetical protein